MEAECTCGAGNACVSATQRVVQTCFDCVCAVDMHSDDLMDWDEAVEKMMDYYEERGITFV